MIDAGDIVVADLRREQRWRVVVVSNSRFNRISERAIVIPELPGRSTDPPMPWHLSVGDGIYALDVVLTVQQSALLDVVGRATSSELERVRRAVRLIAG